MRGLASSASIASIAVALAVPSLGHLPPGFELTPIFSNLNRPTNICFSPDGRVFVAEKSGIILVFASEADITPTQFADLRPAVYDSFDRGLLGMALDPQFPSQPYVYVLYVLDAPIGQTPPVYFDVCSTAPTEGCLAGARLSRLTAAGDVMTGPELVLLEGWCQQYRSHSVGDLRFGPDGALYVSAGDGASFSFVDTGQYGNPCDDPPGEGGALRSQDLRTPLDPADWVGSILRIDPASGLPLPDNPLAGGIIADDDRHIAYGLRNPFRFAFRPGTSELWIADVGWFEWEELNRIVDPLAAPIANFGWPCFENSVQRDGYAATALCQDLYAEVGGVTPPYWAYSHMSPVFPGGCPAEGSSLTGIAFYDATAFPAEYQGALFLCDSTRSCLWGFPAIAEGLPDIANPFEFAHDIGVPVDLEVSPTGDLAVVDYIGGKVWRIRYVGDNQSPTASFFATPDSGPIPLSVVFDGSESRPTGGSGPLAFSWDLDGDGVFGDCTAPVCEAEYAAPGTRNVTLRVTDVESRVGEFAIRVTAGNSRPQPLILAPSPGDLWRVGDVIAFSGVATDAESGTLGPEALEWSVVLYHCMSGDGEFCHAHSLESFSGVSGGSFVAPNHDFPAYLSIRLTATDDGIGQPGVDSLSAGLSMRLDPETTMVRFESLPSGLGLVFGGQEAVAPFEREVIVGSINSVSARALQVVDDTQYEFINWSNGAAITHDIVATPDMSPLIATFAVRCPRSVDGDQDVDLTDLTTLMANFGRSSGAQPSDGDMDDDGDVDLNDLTQLLATFGLSC